MQGMIEDTSLGERFPASELMGVYLLDGAGSRGAIGARVRDISLDATRVPDLTLLAGSPAEAAERLIGDGEVRAVLSILDAEAVDAGVLGQGRTVALTMMSRSGRGGGGARGLVEVVAYVGAPSALVLSELLAFVPSPFTGEVGVLSAVDP